MSSLPTKIFSACIRDRNSPAVAAVHPSLTARAKHKSLILDVENGLVHQKQVIIIVINKRSHHFRKMERFSSGLRKSPLQKANQNVFETTMIAFPSPNSDTQSTIHQTPDFHAGSALANRFKNDHFNPTSPLRFDSESIIRSPDSDMLLFRPEVESHSPKEIPAPRVGTPNMFDVLEEYDRFMEANKPQSMPFSELLARIGDLDLRFELMKPKSIAPRSFKMMYETAKSSIKAEIETMENDIERIEARWNYSPPDLLSNGETITTEDIKILRSLTQVFNMNAIVDIETCEIECLRTLQQEKEKVHVLQNKFQDMKLMEKNSVLLRKIENLMELRNQIESLQGSGEQGRVLGERYVDLRDLLSFIVTSIRNNRATIVIPSHSREMEVRDPMSLHSEIAKSQRGRDLQDEVYAIMEVLPFTTMNNKCVTTTFARGNMRFQVAFPTKVGYPWVKIVPEIKVYQGKEKQISAIVKRACRECPLIRKPILAICQRLYQELKSLGE